MNWSDHAAKVRHHIARVLAAAVVVVVIAPGCGSVTTPSKPEVHYGPGRVAVGSAMTLSTSWEGWCEYSEFMKGAFSVGAGENTSYPCRAVDYDATISCPDRACRWRAIGPGQFEVVPTRPGVLRARVIFKPHGLESTRTIDLEEIEVMAPTHAAVARCDLWGRGQAQVDVALYAGKTELASDARIRVKGGAECRLNEYAYADDRANFTCPIDATTADLEVFAPGHYTVPARASCSPVFPRPEGGIAGSAPPGTRYVFDVESSQCPDRLMRETREAFAEYGWKEESTPAAGPTRYVASRTGAKVDVDIGEYKNALGEVSCRWTLRSDAAALRGTHEVVE